MDIQILDKRPALSLAIGHAKEQGEPRLPEWEAELARMVGEVTRKFHGSLTTENVRRGLETAVGILSLGLMHASKGGVDPELWHSHLLETGFKETSREAVELVKACAALPSTDFLSPGGALDFDLSPREHLLRFAKTGYKALRAMEADRRRNKLHIDLARWLLSNTAAGPSARRNLSTVKGNVSAEDVFGYILPRQAGLTGEHLREETEVPEELDDFDFAGHAILIPARLWSDAKKRFDAFAATLPSELKPGLEIEGESWFDIHVRRAEPAPAKATPKPPVKKAASKAPAKKATPKTPAKKATPKAAPAAPKASKTPKPAKPRKKATS